MPRGISARHPRQPPARPGPGCRVHIDRGAPIEQLLAAYARGAFPMGGRGGVRWFDPAERCVFGLRPGDLRVSRSLRQTIARGRFVVTADTAFDRVIEACASAREHQPAGSGWIDPTIRRWYRALHHAGHAHSVEAWLDGQLVGGLYGVSLRGLFAGESMFSRPDIGGTNASKVCLVALWRHLQDQHYAVLDAQFWTPHLASLGAVRITRAGYRRLLWAALVRGAAWGRFSPRF